MMWTNIFVSRWGRAQMPSALQLRALACSNMMTDARSLDASEGDRHTHEIQRGRMGSIPGSVVTGSLWLMAALIAPDRQLAHVRNHRHSYRVRARRRLHL